MSKMFEIKIWFRNISDERVVLGSSASPIVNISQIQSRRGTVRLEKDRQNFILNTGTEGDMKMDTDKIFHLDYDL